MVPAQVEGSPRLDAGVEVEERRRMEVVKGRLGPVLAGECSVVVPLEPLVVAAAAAPRLATGVIAYIPEGAVVVERRGGWALAASSSLVEVGARSGRLVRPQVSWAVVEAAEVQQGQPGSFLRARYAQISQHRRVEEVRCTWTAVEGVVLGIPKGSAPAVLLACRVDAAAGVQEAHCDGTLSWAARQAEIRIRGAVAAAAVSRSGPRRCRSLQEISPASPAPRGESRR